MDGTVLTFSVILRCYSIGCCGHCRFFPLQGLAVQFNELDARTNGNATVSDVLRRSVDQLHDVSIKILIKKEEKTRRMSEEYLGVTPEQLSDLRVWSGFLNNYSAKDKIARLLS